MLLSGARVRVVFFAAGRLRVPPPPIRHESRARMQLAIVARNEDAVEWLHELLGGDEVERLDCDSAAAGKDLPPTPRAIGGRELCCFGARRAPGDGYALGQQRIQEEQSPQ